MAVRRIPRIILDGDAESASYMAREGIRQLGILKELMSFNDLQQDIRKVEYIDGSRIVCRSCFGEDVVYLYAVKEEKWKFLPKLYVYVTISNYVTIWDLLTGEVAIDICNNDGKIYDYYGEPLITFPCHKSELVRWLEGIKDRPTRQVLKDNPEDRKDYLANNDKDMGEENRIEKFNPEDPSANCYYGITDIATFENYTQVTNDGCEPHCCSFDDWDNPCTLPNLESCTLFVKNMWDTPLGDHPDSEDSFIVNALTDNYCDGYITYTGYVYWEICRNYRRTHQTTSYVKYLQTFFLLSKHLYLCTYPSPKYSPILSPECYINYCCPETTHYENPIDFAVDRTAFICKYWFLRQMFPLRKNNRSGQSITIRTDMGNLLLDYTPTREREEDTPMLYEIMSEAAEGCGCFYVDIPEGVCSKVTDLEVQAYLWEDNYCGQPAHATDLCGWSSREEHVLVDDLAVSENMRTAVSWCGSIYNYRTSPEGQTHGWYRVLLRFTMGKFFTEGDITEYCPSDPVIIEEWDNRAASERFSSVQATIELEHPKDYPKTRSVPIPDNPSAIRYKRPEDCSSLCAFPDRDCGYPEDEENNICYPFDGTYDIYTLGEAVEKLINSHYEDGSDDPLLVYLYERPNMISQITG